jgi:hypothetical protein
VLEPLLLPPLLLVLVPLLPPLLDPPPSAEGDGVVVESEHAACAASDIPRMTTEWKSLEVFIADK